MSEAIFSTLFDLFDLADMTKKCNFSDIDDEITFTNAF